MADDKKQEQEMLAQFLLLEQEIAKREAVGHPGSYGMPDLLFPQGFTQGTYAGNLTLTPEQIKGKRLEDSWLREPLNYEESEEQYTLRQNKALEEFITSLFILKDGRRVYIRVIEKMMRFLADVFFRRVSKVILWKPRGGGGSLSASVLIWLILIYHRKSVVDIAGCLLPETPVWIKDRGWVSIKDVQVGDTVRDRNGNLVPVLNVIKKHWERQITTVSPVGFKGLSFTSDHRISVLRDVVKRKYKRLEAHDFKAFDSVCPEWIAAGDLTESDAFVVERPQYKSQKLPRVSAVLNSNGLGNAVNIEWSPELCRFIGYWLAEGSLYKKSSESNKQYVVRLDINKDDFWKADAIELIRSLFNRKAYYDEPGKKCGTKEARIIFSSKEVCTSLETIFGRYSYGKTIPWELITGLSDECLWQLLSGYLRGDGSAHPNNRGIYDISCYTVSSGLAASLYWISLRLGIFPSTSFTRPNVARSGFKKSRDAWEIRWGSLDADRILKKAFPHIVQKSRECRQRKVWFTEKRVYVGLTRIEKQDYKGDVYDLTIDGNPSFSVPMMCAHNSGEQAKVIYAYVKELWDSVPGLKQGLVSGDPLVSETRLKTGVTIRCIPATDRQARGKHPPCMVVDEACLLPGTLVITERGLIKVESVVVGDTVITFKNKKTRVKNVWSKPYTGEVYELTRNGKKSTVTGDHQIYVSKINDRGGSYNWVRADAIVVGDYVYDSISRTAYRVDATTKREYAGEVWDIEVEDGESFMLPHMLVHNCQKDPRAEEAIRAALQGAMSETDHIIVLLSTFHLPQGLFQEYWDLAEEKGFSRYLWNAIDTMCQCTRGLETATETDPKALEYCKTCFLTDKRLTKDPITGDEREVWEGCYGQGRDSIGWATYEDICECKKLNIGTNIFNSEYLCQRPNYDTAIYDPVAIDECLVDPMMVMPETDRISVGIDWGLETENSMCLTLVVRKLDCIYLHDVLYTDHTLVSDVCIVLNQWRSLYNQNFPIICDASHPFNNMELVNAGFDVRPLNFGTWKKTGIQNISKYLTFKRIKINRTLSMLVSQLKKYRMSNTGSIVKKDDHGPDSLLCATMNWRFEDEFGPDIAQAAVLEQQKRMIAQMHVYDERKFNTEGMAVVKTVDVRIIGDKRDKDVLVF